MHGFAIRSEVYEIPLPKTKHGWACGVRSTSVVAVNTTLANSELSQLTLSVRCLCFNVSDIVCILVHACTASRFSQSSTRSQNKKMSRAGFADFFLFGFLSIIES